MSYPSAFDRALDLQDEEIAYMSIKPPLCITSTLMNETSYTSMVNIPIYAPLVTTQKSNSPLKTSTSMPAITASLKSLLPI